MTGIKAQAGLIRIATTLSVKALEEACVVAVNYPNFTTAFGSAGEHHAYEGGLAIHTEEVVTFAMNMCRMFPNADEDVVITAAIFHDLMKIREYNPMYSCNPFHPNTVVGIQKTPYRNLVRHVAGSHAEFLKCIAGKEVPESKELNIEHAILAHHGRKEHGSPIEPQTVEAYILHYADMLSVKFGPATKRLDQ